MAPVLIMHSTPLAICRALCLTSVMKQLANHTYLALLQVLSSMAALPGVSYRFPSFVATRLSRWDLESAAPAAQGHACQCAMPCVLQAGQGS